ncbi:MAG: glutaminase [Anaerolineales bacterium]|nr:glutaminase [Anaerolineales bacterium]MCB9126933.1 glutaminase [Ardenticatenales bacterium]MCB9171478.1 glutaminase [Ardenticatenales bacterium]
MDYDAILNDIYADVQPLLGHGAIATYIPELAHVDPLKFGMAVQRLDGRVHTIGDAHERFSIQSISKLFTLTLAMQREGDAMWQRLGREPSGNAFNSLVQLEYEHGIPRNPFINAGALVVTDIILSHFGNAQQSVLDFVRRLSQTDDLTFDAAVAASERATGFRNAAMGYFLKSFGNLHNDTVAVLDAYFHHCSLAMSCSELARAATFLANGGRLPWNDESIVTASQAKYINSLMLTCGTYDSVGDFAYRVGLPGKSGVGGGIVAVMPEEFAVCVWSPALNESGNSLAGTRALELFTTLTGISIF